MLVFILENFTCFQLLTVVWRYIDDDCFKQRTLRQHYPAIYCTGSRSLLIRKFTYLPMFALHTVFIWWKKINQFCFWTFMLITNIPKLFWSTKTFTSFCFFNYLSITKANCHFRYRFYTHFPHPRHSNDIHRYGILYITLALPRYDDNSLSIPWMLINRTLLPHRTGPSSLGW